MMTKLFQLKGTRAGVTCTKVKLIFLVLCQVFSIRIVAQTQSSTPVFMPYCDATLWPLYSIENTTTSTVCNYILAFVVDDPTKPGPNGCWGGFSSYDTSHYKTKIQQLRALGGDIMVSFGGANGQELATITPTNNLSALVNAYQHIITSYQLKYIDFDIEGAAVADTVSIDLRCKAIKQLLINNPGLKVWFTLPVMPTGLDFNGLRCMRTAIVKHGIDLEGVNIMAMDYGAFFGNMGGYAIQAADSLFSQLTKAYSDGGFTKTPAQVRKKVGVTPMIGQNDVIGEIFYLNDATALLNYAISKNIGLLSMWSINRDQPCASASSPLYSCTQIPQSPYAFTSIFKGTNGALNKCGLLSTGVEASEADETILVFPNPANVSLQISSKDGIKFEEIYIYDILGNMMYKNSQGDFKINISEWAQGIYFIRGKKGDSIFSTKFIKE